MNEATTLQAGDIVILKGTTCPVMVVESFDGTYLHCVWCVQAANGNWDQFRRDKFYAATLEKK